MFNQQILKDLKKMNGIIEEKQIKEIPSFFIQRLYNNGAESRSIIEDFLWWSKMKDLYDLQLGLKKYEDCQNTLKEMKERLGYYHCFQSMENELARIERNTPYFIYEGRDDVTWEEIPLDVRKHDYPYYFDEDGNDCFPFKQEQ